MQMAEEALVQNVRVPACTREPGGDGGLLVAEDAFGRRWVQPFSQRRQDHSDLLRRGFHPVQRRVAPGTEGGVARLAAKGLDPLDLAMLAIANQRMHVRIRVGKVEARSVGTG